MFTNAISGAVLFCLSIGYYISADAMPSSILDTAVTSSAFPKMLAVAGAILSLALIAQNLVTLRMAPSSSSPASEEDDAGAKMWFRHRRALGLLAIVLLFVAALEIVGYPVAIALLILAVSIYQGYPPSWVSFAVAVAGGLLFWLFFMVLLGIHMPLGLFGRMLASNSFLPFT